MGCIIRTDDGLRWEPDECQTKIEGWEAKENILDIEGHWLDCWQAGHDFQWREEL